MNPYDNNMKKNILFLSAVGFLLVSCMLFGTDIKKIKEEIRMVIDRQQNAWNAHDIEGFMADYWKSKDFTFQSGDHRLYGWETLLNRYRTNYAGEKMGQLTFSDIQICVLSEDSAYALGRWKVEQGNTKSEGVFTIIFRRFPEGWKIIHDHSS